MRCSDKNWSDGVNFVSDVQIENGTTIPPALAALHQNGDSLDADATITSDESNSAGGGVPPLNGKSTGTSSVPAAALDEDTRDTTASFADTDNGSPVVSADDLGENSASASSVSESTKDSMQVSC